jgi:hypothetical protein
MFWKYRIVRGADRGLGWVTDTDTPGGHGDADVGCDRDPDRRSDRDPDRRRLRTRLYADAGCDRNRDAVAEWFVARLHADTGLDRDADCRADGHADPGCDCDTDPRCGNGDPDLDAATDGYSNSGADCHTDGLRLVADSGPLGNDRRKHQLLGSERIAARDLHVRRNQRYR